MQSARSPDPDRAFPSRASRRLPSKKLSALWMRDLEKENLTASAGAGLGSFGIMKDVVNRLGGEVVRGVEAASEGEKHKDFRSEKIFECKIQYL